MWVNRLFPLPGEQFVTNRRRPILTLEADDSPGIHDLLCAACDPARYEGLGVEGWHASCQENLLTVMQELGHPDVEVPQPINLFMNIPVTRTARSGGTRRAPRPATRSRCAPSATATSWCSACPQDIVPINNGNPGPLELEVVE